MSSGRTPLGACSTHLNGSLPPFKTIVSIIQRTLPHALIGVLRRRFAKSIQSGPWDADQELEQETVDAPELPDDRAVLLGATQAVPGFSPGGGDCASYYKGILRTAIDSGGLYGGHRIPVPWLRVILAGLEDKPIEPELMWYEIETEGPQRSPLGIPSYGDLFPSERDISEGLR